MGVLYCCKQNSNEKDITLNTLFEKDICSTSPQLPMETVNSINGENQEDLLEYAKAKRIQKSHKENEEITLETQSIDTFRQDSPKDKVNTQHKISVESASPLVVKKAKKKLISKNKNGIDEELKVKEPRMNKKKKKSIKKDKEKETQLKFDSNSNNDSQFTSESEKTNEKVVVVDNKQIDAYANQNPNYFELLNLNPERKEIEKKLEEDRKDEIEKIYFKIELNNLSEKLHKNQVFQAEVLFTNSDNIHDFFTVGNTHRYKPSDDLSVRFPEEFEINYLFERIQFLRIVVYSSDNTTSEISINIAQVVKQKFNDCIIPIDLINGECILYTENKIEKSKQEISIIFQRKPQNTDKTTPCIYVDFQFNSPDQTAKKLYYELITEYENAQKKFIYKSNEVMGVGPFEFTVVSVENNNVFLDAKIAIYCFEFYEDENYIGQIIIDKSEMDEIIDSISPVPYVVSNEGNQFNVFKKSSHIAKNSNRNLHNPISPIIMKKNSNLIRRNNIKKPTKKQLPLPGIKVNKVKEEIEDYEEDSFEVKRYATQIPPVSQSDDCFQVGKANILYKDIKSKKFIDYIVSDLDIVMPIAIDFTLSNLNPHNPKSLHTFDLANNKYINTIKNFVKIIKDYASSKKFPVYGFGGILKESKDTNHCFYLNSGKEPYINHVDDIIINYEKRIKTIHFSNPTNIQYILKEIIQMAKKSKTESKSINYYTVLITTDGSFDDFNEAKNLFIDASKLPISIFIVGIGNAHFGKLEYINESITSTSGERLYRDMVSFMKLSDYDNEDSLAQTALQKIPIQIVQYCKLKGL